MIEKFNFYDVYGYFIPGIVLVAMFYGPFLLTAWQPMPTLTEFTAVVLAVIVSYLIGYFMQSMATNAISSKFNGVHPSTRMLNPSDSTFTPEFKLALQAQARSLFGLDVDVSKTGDQLTDAARTDAFFLARALNNSRGSGAYSEQFQGLYSMMRGLVVSFGLGCAYMIGWGASYWHHPCIIPIALVILTISLAATLGLAIYRFKEGLRSNSRCSTDRWSLVAFAALLFACGTLIAQSQIIDFRADLIYWTGFVVLLAACFRFYVAYEFFSNEFAKAVWTGFRVSTTGTTSSDR